MTLGKLRANNFSKFFSVEKKLFFPSRKIFRFFLVAAGGLLYLDLNFEGNRRRSDLSQRNIGTSRNWSKMSTSELILFEPQRIHSHDSPQRGCDHIRTFSGKFPDFFENFPNKYFQKTFSLRWFFFIHFFLNILDYVYRVLRNHLEHSGTLSEPIRAGLKVDFDEIFVIFPGFQKVWHILIDFGVLNKTLL